MRESIITLLEELFGNAYTLIVFIGSAIPLTEQRATIPLGIYWGLPPLQVFTLALLGSYIPVPFLLLFFKKTLAWMHKASWLDWLTGFIDRKIRRVVSRFEKSTEIALIIFVAIPLPGTGLWTGSAVASVLGFNLKKSFLCIFLGAVLSAVILTAASSLIKTGFSLF